MKTQLKLHHDRFYIVVCEWMAEKYGYDLLANGMVATIGASPELENRFFRLMEISSFQFHDFQTVYEITQDQSDRILLAWFKSKPLKLSEISKILVYSEEKGLMACS